ncbi:TetR/AcrR family transcriptional regulator [Actinomadura montaniterrae]|uniref:TetR/AcrR family transcriptional regulator n=1 Tax=Actinomadura montaniterrae TaxID=1803903 RepID=A0A6L3VNN8_9ACTN|nr:TetR/AcrR family transcriptional regulator [Actinomadura montaniterrae]KAB2370683.1 TetR/AcrR family transcriptional regulator [Actinomadura montaniterrae]
MSDSSPRRLPRGRSALSPEEVERIQRSRLCAAMAEVMAEKGYVATSVADVLQRSGVSRQSFYQVFDSKLDCFMAAFDVARELLVQHLLEMIGADEAGRPTAGAGGAAGDAMDRFEQGFTAYLEALAIELPYTRLFLIEVYAAGPEAIRRRADLQNMITDVLADLLGVRDDAGRFTCRMIVAATSTLVTNAVADNDLDALRAVGPPLVRNVRTLWEAGAFRHRPVPG